MLCLFRENFPLKTFHERVSPSDMWVPYAKEPHVRTKTPEAKWMGRMVKVPCTPWLAVPQTKRAEMQSELPTLLAVRGAVKLP